MLDSPFIEEEEGNHHAQINRSEASIKNVTKEEKLLRQGPIGDETKLRGSTSYYKI